MALQIWRCHNSSNFNAWTHNRTMSLSSRDKMCSSCMEGKHQQHNVPKLTLNLAETKNELIHCDICGPLPSYMITNGSLKPPRSLIITALIPIVLTQKILNPRVSTCTECRFGPPHHKLKSFHLYFSSNFKIFVDSRMILELVRMG